MAVAIESFLQKFLSNEMLVLICAMIPIIELRGAIPLGIGLGLSYPVTIALSIIGNIIPVPFVIFFMKPIFKFCKRTFLKSIILWLERRAEKKAVKVLEKNTWWILMVFVAIPLPGTGAWTGSMIASFLDMKFKDAIIPVVLGVLIAAVIVTILTFLVSHGIKLI